MGAAAAAAGRGRARGHADRAHHRAARAQSPALMKLRRLSLTAAALLAAYAGGLVWFAGSIADSVEDTATTTDAIVVLTGGSQRVQAGLQLLTAGKAKKLFVSGVYHGTDVTALLHAQRQSPDAVQCCIVLG